MHDLAQRRLYLCVGRRDDLAEFLPAVLRGGVDVVQLRDKDLADDERITTARAMISICRDFDVPFIMNDFPLLALEVGADGVHVGQDDTSAADCRRLLGAEAIIGLSTHAPDEFDAALEGPATYLSAGPIEPTPTKPGRAGTGLDYPLACERRSDRPVFVTGGVSADNVASLVLAGLRHFVVVRALTASSSPEASARSLRDEIDRAVAAARD